MNKAVILLVFANDQQQPLDEIAKESQVIRKVLRDALDDSAHFEVELLPYSSPEDLFAELRRFNNQVVILHFAGHSNSELWKLHSGAVNATGMAEIFKLQDSMRLLFLNGCKNHQQVEVFAKAGVPAVIATSQPINDQQARVFATEFYKKLVDGKAMSTSIEEAYQWAKATASALDYQKPPRSFELEEEAEAEQNQWIWNLIETQDQATQWSLAEVRIYPKISQELADYKAKDLQNRWERLSKKIRLLRQQYDNETRVEEQLRIDVILEKVLQDRIKVEEEMRKS